MLIGEVAQVELISEPTGGVTATCREHWMRPACEWTETYDDLADASEYAADHADHERG